MKVLITGGAGYIGSHLYSLMKKMGYDPVILDNFCNSKNIVLDKIKEIVNDKVSFIEGDIMDIEFMINLLRKFKIDSVIHLAGFKSVSDSYNSPIDYYKNNVFGTLCLIEAMKMFNKI